MIYPKFFQSIRLASAVLLLTSTLILIGCAASTPQSAESPEAVSQAEVADDLPSAGGADTTTSTDAREMLPTAVETAVLQDIVDSESVAASELEIESAEAKAWPDGCLGLGGPDDICTFVIVNGWEVVVSQGDSQWVYRTDADGLAVRRAEEES